MRLLFIHTNIKVQLSNMNDLFCNLFNLTILTSCIGVQSLKWKILILTSKNLQDPSLQSRSWASLHSTTQMHLNSYFRQGFSYKNSFESLFWKRMVTFMSLCFYAPYYGLPNQCHKCWGISMLK